MKRQVIDLLNGGDEEVKKPKKKRVKCDERAAAGAAAEAVFGMPDLVRLFACWLTRGAFFDEKGTASTTFKDVMAERDGMPYRWLGYSTIGCDLPGVTKCLVAALNAFASINRACVKFLPWKAATLAIKSDLTFPTNLTVVDHAIFCSVYHNKYNRASSEKSMLSRYLRMTAKDPNQSDIVFHWHRSLTVEPISLYDRRDTEEKILPGWILSHGYWVSVGGIITLSGIRYVHLAQKAYAALNTHPLPPFPWWLELHPGRKPVAKIAKIPSELPKIVATWAWARDTYRHLQETRQRLTDGDVRELGQ